MEDIDDFADFSALQWNQSKSTYNVRKRENPMLLDGTFLIGDFLGEGVSAKVYEALDLRTVERRAVKMYEIRQIFKSYNYDERLEMLKTEIKLLTSLRHKHLIRYLDIYSNHCHCTHPKDICIVAVMDYCIGCVDDLMAAYEHRQLPMERARKYFRQLMLAVQYLHGQGVFHKDIKTANMLIDLCDDIKLTDLGVCEQTSQFDPLPVCIKTNGSFIYQAPELFDFDKRHFLGNAVDVWACAVSLYYMVAGRYPFEGKLLQVIDQIRNENIVLPNKFQNEKYLLDLLSGMMHKNADQRMSVTEVLRHPWVVQDSQQQLVLDHWCMFKMSAYFGLLPRSVITHVHSLFVFRLLEVIVNMVRMFVHTYLIHSAPEKEVIRPKPRTKYEDVYRSMSITPYLHQLHYPLVELQNQVQISEDEFDEFDHLRRIALIRSNRAKRKKRKKYRFNALYYKFGRIMGFDTNDLDRAGQHRESNQRTYQ